MHSSSLPNASESFVAAYRALQSGDAAALRAAPVRESDANGNTLLNMAVSLGVDAALLEALLQAGADGNQGNRHGWTPLHQAGYANRSDLAVVLLANGASPLAEARGSGGTPLVAALFWGHREVAEVLAGYSKAPGNLRVAAGMGDEQLLDECFRDEKLFTVARGFYRPHSGFPEWRPTDDRQQALDEAMVWACKSGRTAMLARLVHAGARLDADPYRGTPLIWAAYCNRQDTAAWLVDNGAAVNQRGTFGGLTHGQGVTAVRMAAECGHLEMVRLLVERGADPTIKDALYGADAAGAANHFGHTAVRDYLRSSPA